MSTPVRESAREDAWPEDRRDEAPRELFDSGVRRADLDPARPTFVSTPWGPFALYVDSRGTVHALDAFCPHLEGPLFQGTVTEDVVVCPWHLWRFSLQDGRCVGSRNGEGAAARLRRCPVVGGPSGTLHLGPPDAPRRELPGV